MSDFVEVLNALQDAIIAYAVGGPEQEQHKEQFDALRALLLEMGDAAQKENAALRTALEVVEWVGTVGTPRCPWCHRMYAEGHAFDCRRQKLLNS